MSRLANELRTKKRVWATAAVLLPWAVALLVTAASRTLLFQGSWLLWNWPFWISMLPGIALFYYALRPEKPWDRLLLIAGYGILQAIIYVVVLTAIMQGQFAVGVATGRCSRAI